MFGKPLLLIFTASRSLLSIQLQWKNCTRWRHRLGVISNTFLYSCKLLNISNELTHTDCNSHYKCQQQQGYNSRIKHLNYTGAHSERLRKTRISLLSFPVLAVPVDLIRRHIPSVYPMYGHSGKNQASRTANIAIFFHIFISISQ